MGFSLKMLEQLRNFYKTSVTCNSLGHYEEAPALVYRRKISGMQKKGRENI